MGLDVGEASEIVGMVVVDGAMDGEVDDSVEFLFCVGWVVIDGESDGICVFIAFVVLATSYCTCSASVSVPLTSVELL